MERKCNATYGWFELEVGSKYTAKISCQGCKLDQRELGFGRLDGLEKAAASMEAYLNIQCPVRASVPTT